MVGSNLVGGNWWVTIGGWQLVDDIGLIAIWLVRLGGWQLVGDNWLVTACWWQSVGGSLYL